MNKIVIRVLSILSALAVTATVAASEGPRPVAGDDTGASTLGCTKSGMTCGSSGQCCSKSCNIQHGRVVGRCN